MNTGVYLGLSLILSFSSCIATEEECTTDYIETQCRLKLKDLKLLARANELYVYRFLHRYEKCVLKTNEGPVCNGTQTEVAKQIRKIRLSYKPRMAKSLTGKQECNGIGPLIAPPPDKDGIYNCIRLPLTLRPGNVITVQGTFFDQTERANIDLKPNCFHRDLDIITYHQTIWFSSNELVLSYRDSRGWSNTGLRYVSSNYTFRTGKSFTYQLKITEDEFIPYFDGTNVGSYKQYRPAEEVRFIELYYLKLKCLSFR